MTKRLLVLLGLLFIRYLSSAVSLANIPINVLISVSGSTIIMSNSDTKCIMRIADYWAEFQGWCRFSQGDKIRLIGRTDRRVIDKIIGRIWLRQATIDVLSTAKEKVSFLSGIRERLFQNFSRYLPADEGALVLGLTFGVKENFSRIFYQKILNVGVAHIVAASGFNVVLIGGTIQGALYWVLRRNRAVVVTLLVLLLYAWLCGTQPPMVRAWWMYAFLQIGMLLGRVSVTWWGLVLSAGVMSLEDKYVFTNLSFQLTFLSCFGLIYFEPEIRKRLTKRIPESWIDVTGLSVSLSALIGTAPIVWWTFGKVNLIGIVSNILIVPLVPLLTGLGFGMVLPWIFTPIVYPLAWMVVRLIGIFGA